MSSLVRISATLLFARDVQRPILTKTMKYFLLITLFFLPITSSAQLRILGGGVTVGGIPVNRTEKMPDTSYTTPQLASYAYFANYRMPISGDTVQIVDSTFSFAGKDVLTTLSFRVDTVHRKLYQFSYTHSVQENFGDVDTGWVIITSSFDNIALDPFQNSLGTGFRGYITGTQLRDVNFTYFSHYAESYESAPGDVYETIDTLLPNNYSDQSSIEVLLYFTSKFSNVHSAQPINDFVVYPNPASDLLYVRTDNAKAKLQIRDILGRSIEPQVMNVGQDAYTIDASSLPPGSYYLQQGGQTRKILIAR